jgi:prepilin-type N-terminal cleavage/methylation domain-containing protein/prepilin-type processing-associated H-X9-DG protein
MKTRRAFTLVEVLVVIGIVGLLAALLLPAIFSARESARRTECLNNQRNLALAVLNYELVQKSFPGYRNVQAIDTTGQWRMTGWVFPLLPHLENSAVFNAHGTRGADEFRGIDPNLTIAGLTCPSDIAAQAKTRKGPLTATSYVGNVGQIDAEATALVPGDWRSSGMFLNRFPFDSSGDTIRTESVTAKYVSGADGLSKTLLLSENADAGFWTESLESTVGFAWEPTLVEGRPEPATLLRINEDTGREWAGMMAQAVPEGGSALCCIICRPRPPIPRRGIPTGGPGGDPVNDPPTSTTNQQLVPFARPSSYHSGGVVVTYADAHVQFLRENVEYTLYSALMTPNGAHSTFPGTADLVPAVYRDANATAGAPD